MTENKDNPIAETSTIEHSNIININKDKDNYIDLDFLYSKYSKDLDTESINQRDKFLLFCASDDNTKTDGQLAKEIGFEQHSCKRWRDTKLWRRIRNELILSKPMQKHTKGALIKMAEKAEETGDVDKVKLLCKIAEPGLIPDDKAPVNITQNFQNYVKEKYPIDAEIVEDEK